MGLRGVPVGGAFMAIGLWLIGCDDFKSNSRPARAAAEPPPPATSPATPVTPVAPLTAMPPTPAQLRPAPADPVLSQAPAPAFGSASPRGKAIDAAVFAAAAPAASMRRVLIRAEVILDRAHFSPGAVDGRDGSNFRRALAAFETARGLAAPAPAGKASLGAAAWQALITADGGPVTQDYVITPADVKGPFLGTVPATMAAQARLPRLGYTGPVQALAEKFHMDQALLRSLNPGADFAKAGTSLVVIRPAEGPLPAVARLQVDKSADQVRAYDAAGKVVAEFPATVGSTERPAPSGQFAVRFVVHDPTYTYDPARLTFGKASMGKLTIQPGPNNPVGSTWIDLTVETYGIHGAPDPREIGKTASHGCVRLTNWDAAALGRAVKKGVPVLFVGAARKA